MVDNRSRGWLQLASAVVFFILVVLIQFLLEWIFGDAIDAAFIRQAVITSVIMSALFAFFTWWRERRSRVER
jgi:cell shape-determining protein MreD